MFGGWGWDEWKVVWYELDVWGMRKCGVGEKGVKWGGMIGWLCFWDDNFLGRLGEWYGWI